MDGKVWMCVMCERDEKRIETTERANSRRMSGSTGSRCGCAYAAATLQWCGLQSHHWPLDSLHSAPCLSTHESAHSPSVQVCVKLEVCVKLGRGHDRCSVHDVTARTHLKGQQRELPPLSVST